MCLICNRDAEDGFCKLHEKAHQNLIQGYAQWKKALTISWRDYLEAVAKNPNTGLWVKEVAEHLLKEARTNEGNTSYRVDQTQMDL